jgi:glycosyltransferase involved in cell wall biosynthesis
MAAAIVIPCLNEERYIESAASSLGFGETGAPAADDVFLFLVDNGSTDRTPAVMERIASASRPGSVRILVEPERGFVPPRRRGAFAAADLVAELGIEPEDVLILQADADTLYLPEYSQRMWEALAGRQGFLLEGAIRRSAEFDAAHPEYRALERSIDDEMEAAGVGDNEEVIVDDKACGYLLSDYVRWGGHFREQDRLGGTIHAETTRLFLRARLRHGAVKIRVNPAQAESSRRRIIEEPALHFATSGFPREDAWVKAWRDRHPTAWTVDGFARSSDHPDVREACFYRRAHDLALFALLPWVVGRAAGEPVPDDSRALRLLSLIPPLSAEELAERPAMALSAVLDAIDDFPEAFRGASEP